MQNCTTKDCKTCQEQFCDGPVAEHCEDCGQDTETTQWRDSLNAYLCSKCYSHAVETLHAENSLRKYDNTFGTFKR